MTCFLMVLVVPFFTRLVERGPTRKASFRQASNKHMPQRWLAVSTGSEGGD